MAVAKPEFGPGSPETPAVMASMRTSPISSAILITPSVISVLILSLFILPRAAMGSLASMVSMETGAKPTLVAWGTLRLSAGGMGKLGVGVEGVVVEAWLG